MDPLPRPGVPFTARRPVRLVAIDMGYGHLRAAHALAPALGTTVEEADREPLAGTDERARYARVRAGYEFVSRFSQLSSVGRPLRWLLDTATAIPEPWPRRDLSGPTLGVRYLDRLVRGGLGRELAERLDRENATLVTTFFAPAIAAAHHGGRRIVCVVTDSDVNRAWVSRESAAAPIEYCAPTERCARRLRDYGVPKHHVHVTGFPLPPSLLGPDLAGLRRALARRLVRLDWKGEFRREAEREIEHFLGDLPSGEAGRAPLMTFAIGGAGAQVEIVRQYLAALARPVREGRLRLALVAGLRVEAARKLAQHVAECGLNDLPGDAVTILLEPDFASYFAAFNALLEQTDVLWTKPSEMSFYAALGIPLVFSRPVGIHERANRKWVRLRGAGFKQEHPAYAWDWLSEWMKGGTLAAAAWAGYTRLPKFGTERIAAIVREVAQR